MKAGAIVFRKEMREILRDRRTLIAIGLAALATPLVLFVISQVSTRTVAQAYTVGYTGTMPAGLDVLFNATGLNLKLVDDPAEAASSKSTSGSSSPTRDSTSTTTRRARVRRSPTSGSRRS